MTDLLDAQALFAAHAFANALPIPDVVDTAKRSNFTIQVREFDQFLGLGEHIVFRFELILMLPRLPVIG